MSFMDKARELAEQAQEKLDEVQRQVSDAASPQGGPQRAGHVRYDEHGRPVDDAQASTTMRQ